MDRIPRRVSPIARLALAAQGVYILVISTVPFARLVRAGVADHEPLVLQFVLWSVVPAATLVVAGWAIGGALEPAAERLLRVSATVATAYLALGSLIALADPSTSAIGTMVNLAVLAAGAVGGVGLVRGAPRPAAALAPPPQMASSRSATTMR